jgi:peroxiredoxin
MAAGRPGFEHKPDRHGLIGPFSGRQLAVVLGIVIVAAVVLVAATRPLGQLGPTGPGNPRPTAFLLGSPTVGLEPGSLAPEMSGTRADGSSWALQDVSGHPISLTALRGKGIWINFWASWCPPCQSETPTLRDTYDKFKDRGLAMLGISVQETNPADVAAYAAKYAVGYTIAADLSADVLHLYRVYSLPTQVFIGPDGRIRKVLTGPLSAEQAAAEVEAILPAGGSPAAAASPSRSAAGPAATGSTTP